VNPLARLGKIPLSRAQALRAPMPSRLQLRPRRENSSVRAERSPCCRKTRRRGELRPEITRSERPSRFQSTRATARVSSGRSSPLGPEAVTKRPSRVLRNAQSSSRPLHECPSRSMRWIATQPSS
jgi:hypothetical protein